MRLFINPFNLGTVQKKFSLRSDRMKQARENILQKSLLLIERYSKIESPVRTGRLRASISEGKFLYERYAQIGPTVEYAKYVHWRNPFMERGVERALPDLRKMIKDEVKQAIQ
jgi:hypothetical protein